MSSKKIVFDSPSRETEAIPVGPMKTVPSGYSVESTKMSFSRHLPMNFTRRHSGIVSWIFFSAIFSFSSKVMSGTLLSFSLKIKILFAFGCLLIAKS